MIKERLDLIVAIKDNKSEKEVDELFEKFEKVFHPENFKGKKDIGEDDIMNYGRVYQMYLNYKKGLEGKTNG